MYAGEFFLCYFFVPYKVNIPMYEGGFKQVQYKEYICWMQVKIYISDQTSLRICNSVVLSVCLPHYGDPFLSVFLSLTFILCLSSLV
jgi:hypothetical protein